MTNLSGTNAVIGTLSGSVDLAGSTSPQSTFSGSDLSNAHFQMIPCFLTDFSPEPTLSGTNAMLALIGNIDLRETNLIGVDLSASDLTSAQLTGAIFDNTTIWPNGFDPIAAGAINNDPNSGTDNQTDSSDSNDTVFIVSGGNFNAPFYNFTYESNGSVVDFSSHA